MGYKGTTVQSDADDLTHLHFFTQKTLRQLADQSRFRITRMGGNKFCGECISFLPADQTHQGLQVWDCRLAEVLPTGFTVDLSAFGEKNI